MTDVFGPEILANHVGILGKTGSGKSNLAKVVAEQLLTAGKRVCVLDPTGTWFGLRLTRKSKPSPFNIVIFGGSHGDIPIAAHHGEEIASALARSTTSAIIDLRQMTVKSRTVFATGFAEELLRQNAGILYVIIDESHLFAPKGKVPDPDSGKMLNAFNNLASLGRGVGLILILISQRPAKLHNDSLTQIETLVGMRLIAPHDREAFRSWVKENADEGQATEIMRSLASLPTGTGWVWAPGLDLLEKRSFPLAATLDTGKPSETPDVTLGPIDVNAIRAQLGKVEEERKANDPEVLKARIRELETRPVTVVPAKTVEIKVDRPIPYLDPSLREEIESQVRFLREQVGHLDGELLKIDSALQRALMKNPPPKEVLEARVAVAKDPPAPRPAPVIPAAADPERSERSGPDLVRTPVPEGSPSKPELAVMNVLNQFETRTQQQVSILAGYSPTSGSFFGALASLRRRGFIEGDVKALRLTPEGKAAAPPVDPLPADLLGYWANRLAKPEAAILKELASHHPNGLHQDVLASNAGYSATSGSFFGALAKLRKLDLISGGKDALSISPDLIGG